MSNRIITIFVLILIFFINTTGLVSAAFSFDISSPSATLISSSDQIIDTFVNIIDLPSESYFRISLQKDTGGIYYGYVQNDNNEWSKIQALSGDCLSYFKVSDLNTNLINLKYKIGDDITIDNGIYNLKAHRFTKSCTSYSEGVNLIPIVVSLPTANPTDSPTNSPTQQPTQAPSASPTKSPTPSPTKSPSPKPIQTPTPTTESTEESIILEPEVLSFSTVASSYIPEIKKNKKTTVLPIIFITSGLVFLGYGGYLLYNKRNAKVKENS